MTEVSGDLVSELTLLIGVLHIVRAARRFSMWTAQLRFPAAVCRRKRSASLSTAFREASVSVTSLPASSVSIAEPSVAANKVMPDALFELARVLAESGGWLICVPAVLLRLHQSASHELRNASRWSQWPWIGQACLLTASCALRTLVVVLGVAPRQEE